MSNHETSSQLEASGDRSEVLVSIVVPSLNEEQTIAEFVDWCQEGLKQANVPGEVLIVDSSTDRTAEILSSTLGS